jgi:hypothetical protein
MRNKRNIFVPTLQDALEVFVSIVMMRSQHRDFVFRPMCSNELVS